MGSTLADSSSFPGMKRFFKSSYLSLQYWGVRVEGKVEHRLCSSMAMESQLVVPWRFTAHASRSSSNVPQGCALAPCSLSMVLSFHRIILGFLASRYGFGSVSPFLCPVKFYYCVYVLVALLIYIYIERVSE